MSCISCTTVFSNGTPEKVCSQSGSCPHIQNHNYLENVETDLNQFIFNHKNDESTVRDIARNIREKNSH